MRILRVITVFFAIWSTIFGLAADADAQTTAQRFEGYVYLDTEGRLLPIESDVDIEAFLAEAEVIAASPVPTGITLPQKLTLKGEGFQAYAVFKNIDVERRRVTDIIDGRGYFSLDWRQWFIDCSRCFGSTKTMYYPLKEVPICERRLWLGLKNMEETEVRKRLAPYLYPAEMKALLARRARMVRHFQKLIDERGKTAVLYDIELPSETAPWGID